MLPTYSYYCFCLLPGISQEEYCAAVCDEEIDWHCQLCTIASLWPSWPLQLPPCSTLDDIIELQTCDSSNKEVDKPATISLDDGSIHAVSIAESTTVADSSTAISLPPIHQLQIYSIQIHPSQIFSMQIYHSPIFKQGIHILLISYLQNLPLHTSHLLTTWTHSAWIHTQQEMDVQLLT